MIICKNCGTRNLQKARLCKNCNAPLVAKRKIPSTLITKSERRPIPDTVVGTQVGNEELLRLDKKVIPNTVITNKNSKEVPPTLSFFKKENSDENTELMKEYPLPDNKDDIFVKYNDMVSPIFQENKNSNQESQDIIICTYCRAENVSFYEQCQVCGNKLNAKKTELLAKIVHHGDEEKSYELTVKDNIIGRDEGDIIFPKSQKISKRHCKVYYHQQKVVVDDLGSMNGTYLKLRKPYLLKDGDIFSIGKQIFQFRLIKKADKSIVPKRITGAFLPSATIPKAKLVYFIEQGGYDITIIQSKITFGRESGSIVFSNDKTLSPQHASVFEHKSGYILQDLDSEMGTWIRITRPSILKNNDMFRVGEHIFCLDFPVT
ncbi:FHA domain-containing protein [Candidatus Uabimicrobium sp. HlEnr_7]|uniref:FHA domain-containing protein n=1 Tax=Candidatus Uabimicrobium helgolandensis TaxID=3095367 RepID=UPI0035569A88